MRRLTTAAAFVGLTAAIALLLDRLVRRPDEWQPPPGTPDAASPATEPATPVTTEPADSPEPEAERAQRSVVATDGVIIDLTDSAMAAISADEAVPADKAVPAEKAMPADKAVPVDDEDSPAQN